MSEQHRDVVLDSLSAGDRAQLRELCARSVMLPELGRIKEWVELFEAQAVLHCVQEDAGRLIEHQFTGRADLTRLGEQIAHGQFDIAVGDFGRASRLRHVLGNVCLFAEGARHASGIAQVTIVSVGSGEPRWIASGTYVDVLSKCSAGCWRIQSRTYTADGATAVPLGQKASTAFSRRATHA